MMHLKEKAVVRVSGDPSVTADLGRFHEAQLNQSHRIAFSPTCRLTVSPILQLLFLLLFTLALTFPVSLPAQDDSGESAPKEEVAGSKPGGSESVDAEIAAAKERQANRKAALMKGTQGRGSEGRRELRSLIESQPDTAEWHFEFGVSLVRMALLQVNERQYVEAEESAGKARAELQEALALVPIDDRELKISILNRLAYTQEHFFGDRDSAMTNYQAALDLKPDNKESARGLRKLEEKRVSKRGRTPKPQK